MFYASVNSSCAPPPPEYNYAEDITGKKQIGSAVKDRGL